jgi:hypothetical protein
VGSRGGEVQHSGCQRQGRADSVNCAAARLGDYWESLTAGVRPVLVLDTAVFLIQTGSVWKAFVGKVDTP